MGAYTEIVEMITSLLEDMDCVRGPSLKEFVDALEEVKDQIDVRIDAAKDDVDRKAKESGDL